MRNNIESPFMGVFKKRILKAQLTEYCDFYKLDEKEAREDLTKRGYTVLRI